MSQHCAETKLLGIERNVKEGPKIHKISLTLCWKRLQSHMQLSPLKGEHAEFHVARLLQSNPKPKLPYLGQIMVKAFICVVKTATIMEAVGVCTWQCKLSVKNSRWKSKLISDALTYVFLVTSSYWVCFLI